MPYPVWQPGMRVTAGLLAGMQPLVMRKTSDKSIASSTSVVADAEMVVALAAGAVYTFAGFLKYSGPGDLQIDWSGPSGVLGEYSGFGIGTTAYSGSGTNATVTDTSTSFGYM